MDQNELAHWLHEFNLDCKIKVEDKESCPACLRIAGQLLLVISYDIQKAGLQCSKSAYKIEQKRKK